jgi:D-alanyl-D-alanine dipeptidase
MSELPELVDLSVIFPSLHIDLKYALPTTLPAHLSTGKRVACCTPRR